MTVNIITAPTAEPVTLEELKAFARIDTDDDDVLVASLGVAAREFVEIATGRALMTQTLELVRPAFPEAGLSIPRSPLQSITAVTYLDRSGDEETLVADTDFFVDIDSAPAMIAPSRYWPAAADRSNAVRIRFVAGYADADAVPQTLKTVICALACHWYDNREPGGSPSEVPYHVKRLINSARLWGHL